MKNPRTLILFKIDYELEKMITVLDLDFISITETELIIDQSNENRFLIYDFMWFAICNLINDKIVFDLRRQFNDSGLECRKLIGNEMHGFGSMIQNDNGDRFIQYCKIDLNTLADEIVEVPLDLNLNNNRVIFNFKVDILLLFLILSKFRLINIAGLKRDSIPSLVLKIVRYFNYIFIFFNCF
jgi:hypothetical protein